MWSTQATGDALVGREAEQVQLIWRIEAARNGTSGVLVLEDEPGIGKTALLEWLVGQNDDIQVFRCKGLQSEVELPFGGLGQLLGPLQEILPLLNDGHIDVLRTVFASTGMSSESAPHFGGLRIGSQWRRLPWVCWLSRLTAARCWRSLTTCSGSISPSVEALAFVARRLLAEGDCDAAFQANRGGQPGAGRTSVAHRRWS